MTVSGPVVVCDLDSITLLRLRVRGCYSPAPAVVVVAPDMRGDTPRRIVMAEAGICSYVVPSLFCRFSLSLR